MKSHKTGSPKNTASTSGMCAKKCVLSKHGFQAQRFTRAMLRFQTSIGFALLDQRCRVVERQDKSVSYDVRMKNVF